MSAGLELPLGTDTIAALATVPGRAALAILRISGLEAFTVVARLVDPWPLTVRVASLVVVRDPRTGLLIDHAVVTVYSAPDSYTGEDLVEISVHGGLLTPTLVLSALLTAGARSALPGEFTRRAVINGKLDILQAEAVADLIDARSLVMRETALKQLNGGLSRYILGLRSAILDLEALITYSLDFPDEDSGPVPRQQVTSKVRELIEVLDQLIATSTVGEMIKSGAIVVIAGAPNVGKSSLFNALVGDTRAIVTDIPGTTRDAIEVLVEVSNWPIRLVDTAGLRATEDVIEHLGIEVSKKWLYRADVILACGDTEASLMHVLDRLQLLTSQPIIPVRTKLDIASMPLVSSSLHSCLESILRVRERKSLCDTNDLYTPPPSTAVAVSVVTGRGLDELVNVLTNMLDRCYGTLRSDEPLLTRERHRCAVTMARDEIRCFSQAWEEETPPLAIAAVHLRSAVDALEMMIGVVDADDVLDQVFRTFCIGK